MSTWGNETQFFFSLTPDRILDAVEKSGLRCTGRVLQLASFENRVYEVEVEGERGMVIGKFYRPGRWNRFQILEEHQFLLDLEAEEVPVVPPLVFQGETLFEEEGILFSLFPKVGGRAPDELSDDDLLQIGRLIARIHSVGKRRQAVHRMALNPSTYGRSNLEFLLENWIPATLKARYQAAAMQLIVHAESHFEKVIVQRVHGDFHLGNIIRRGDTFFAIDFDDMVVGPPVQDLWLLFSGDESERAYQREVLLEGYESLLPFPRETFNLIEYLRGLRWIHFSAWIAKRWQDPAFPKAFPHFGSTLYWEEQTLDLERVPIL